jgi:hypothetical protein
MFYAKTVELKNHKLQSCEVQSSVLRDVHYSIYSDDYSSPGYVRYCNVYVKAPYI